MTHSSREGDLNGGAVEHLVGPQELHAPVRTTRGKLFLWCCRALFVAAVCIVTWLALDPRPDLAGMALNDKLAHFAGFFVLAGLGMIGFPGHRASFLCVGGLVLFGGALEVVQAWVPGRQPSVIDLVADAVGIGLALLAVRAVTSRLGKGSGSIETGAAPPSGQRGDKTGHSRSRTDLALAAASPSLSRARAGEGRDKGGLQT